jgi:thiopurine S-methyltransferase
MNQDEWRERWEHGRIGFHRTDPNPALCRFASLLDGDRAGVAYVPLAGKSVDVRYLRDRGHTVIATELVPMAVEQFFDEWGKTPARSARGPFEAYTADGVTFLVGDALALTPELAGPIDFVFDRAALIALPPDVRPRYAEVQTRLLGPGARVLLMTLEHDTDTGPPFSVDRAEVAARFGDAFDIEELDTADERATSPHMIDKGATRVDEVVFLLSRRGG